MTASLNTHSEEEFVESVAQLRSLFAAGDPEAGFLLVCALDPENESIPADWRRRVGASAFECHRVCVQNFNHLLAAAREGNGQAMHLIALYYQSGMPPVTRDMERCRDWCERAVNAGYVFPANELYSLYYESIPSSFFNSGKAQRFLDVMDRAGVRVVPLNPALESPR